MSDYIIKPAAEVAQRLECPPLVDMLQVRFRNFGAGNSCVHRNDGSSEIRGSIAIIQIIMTIIAIIEIVAMFAIVAIVTLNF